VTADQPSGNGFQNVIPMTSVGEVIPLEQRQESMREAVVQVITHLVIRRVPPGERSPLFAAARDLLDQAERSLPELLEAAEPGPEQDTLFRELGLK
jgi:hypothetical protein